MLNTTKTLASLRNLSKPSKHVDNKSINMEQGNILNIKHINIDDADKIGEKIIENDDDFANVFFLAPVSCYNMINEDDDDGDEYWKKHKPVIIDRISSLFNFKYGIDFVILRRGIFSLLVILTKDENGKWFVPKNVINTIIPGEQDIFHKTLEYYYRNTDCRFFPINVITHSNKENVNFDEDNISIENIQVDISFLRSDAFKEYDSEENRAHATFHIFSDGLLHSLALEHIIITFDDEEIDNLIGKMTNKVCYRKQ